MEYTITAANAAIGQIEVTYKNNGDTVATYAIDVPVVDGAFITGEALEAEIQRRAPTWLVERTQEVQAATGFDAIVAQVQAPAVVQTTTTTTPHTFVLGRITV